MREVKSAKVIAPDSANVLIPREFDLDIVGSYLSFSRRFPSGNSDVGARQNSRSQNARRMRKSLRLFLFKPS
jgi:hypothetical protein